MKIYLIPLSLLLLASCANNENKADFDAEAAKNNEQTLNTCKRTQANLTITFHERVAQKDYLCLSNSYAKTYERNISSKAFKRIVKFEELRAPSVASTDDRIETMQPLPTLPPLQVEIIKQVDVPQLDAVSKTSTAQIVFAQHSDLLGPQGKAAVIEFARHYVRKDQDVIYLQAVVSPQSRLNKNQAAVGRGLSVSRLLKKLDVDTKVRILQRESTRYHSLRADGDYVELTVDES